MSRMMMMKTKSLEDIRRAPISLTRKRAGLKASDFNASPVKVYFEDGSFKTFWYSSSTSCKNLVDKVTSKMKQRNSSHIHYLQVRLQSGKNRIPLETDLVANIIKNDTDKLFLVKSTLTSSSTTQKIHKKLAKAFSMEGIADRVSKGLGEEAIGVQLSASGRIQSKKSRQLPKIRKLWKSQTSVVISLPIQDYEFHCPPINYDADIRRYCSGRNDIQVRGLYRNRKKSLSTGDLSCFGLETLETVEEDSDCSNVIPPHQDISRSILPEVPQRTCSFLENCTTDDRYLIQQGIQLSEQMHVPDQSASAHNEVGDIEPLYDTLQAFETEHIYDRLACTSDSVRNGSHYANCGIEAQKRGKITFNGRELHIYDTPKSSGIYTSVSAATDIIETQHENDTIDPTSSSRLSGNDEDELFDDYVDMFQGSRQASFNDEEQNKYKMKPLPPLPHLPSRPKKAGRPRSSVVTRHPPILQDRPWSSHLTEAPPALPPWPSGLAKLSLPTEKYSAHSTHFKPPLAPCNSLEGSCATKGRLSSSTSSPCLVTNLKSSQGSKDVFCDDVFVSFSSSMTIPISLSATSSQPCLHHEDNSVIDCIH